MRDALRAFAPRARARVHRQHPFPLVDRGVGASLPLEDLRHQSPVAWLLRLRPAPADLAVASSSRSCSISTSARRARPSAFEDRPSRRACQVWIAWSLVRPGTVPRPGPGSPSRRAAPGGAGAARRRARAGSRTSARRAPPAGPAPPGRRESLNARSSSARASSFSGPELALDEVDREPRTSGRQAGERLQLGGHLVFASQSIEQGGDAAAELEVAGLRAMRVRAASSAPFRSPSSSRISLSDSHSAGPRSSPGASSCRKLAPASRARARCPWMRSQTSRRRRSSLAGRRALRLGQDLGRRGRATPRSRRAPPLAAATPSSVALPSARRWASRSSSTCAACRAVPRARARPPGPARPRRCPVPAPRARGVRRPRFRFRGSLADTTSRCSSRRRSGGSLLDAEGALVDFATAWARSPADRSAIAQPSKTAIRNATLGAAAASPFAACSAAPAARSSHRLGSSPGSQQELGVSQQRRWVAGRTLGSGGELAQEPFQGGFGRAVDVLALASADRTVVAACGAWQMKAVTPCSASVAASWPEQASTVASAEYPRATCRTPCATWV